MDSATAYFIHRYLELGLTGVAMDSASIMRLEEHQGLPIPPVWRAYLLIAGTSPPPKLVGSGLVVVAPDEHGSGVVDRGPKWQYYTRISFLQAGVVSVVVKSRVLLFARERMRLKSVICPVLDGNLMTYVCLCYGFVGIFGEWPHHTPPPDSRDLDSYTQSFRTGSSLPRSDPFRLFGIGPPV